LLQKWVASVFQAACFASTDSMFYWTDCMDFFFPFFFQVYDKMWATHMLEKEQEVRFSFRFFAFRFVNLAFILVWWHWFCFFLLSFRF
jgi:hypothetical protein